MKYDCSIKAALPLAVFDYRPVGVLENKHPVEQEGELVKEDFLLVPCDSCGSKKGNKCKGQDGRFYGVKMSHKPRKDLYYRQYGREDSYPNGHKDPAIITVAQDPIVVPSEGREEKINSILAAIAFARRIGVTQDQLDRHLAEMVVDAKLNLFP